MLPQEQWIPATYLKSFLTFMISLESTKVNKDEEDDDEGEDGDNRITIE